MKPLLIGVRIVRANSFALVCVWRTIAAFQRFTGGAESKYFSFDPAAPAALFLAILARKANLYFGALLRICLKNERDEWTVGEESGYWTYRSAL